MNKKNTNTRNKRTQKDGWNTGVFTTKFRTSIYIDETLGKVMKKKSKEYGGNMSRLINESLRQHFGMVVQTRMFVPDSNNLNTNKPVVGSSPSSYISSPPIEPKQENMSQIPKDDEITTYKIDVYDTQKFQDTFVEWFSQFKENVIDKEFENGSKGEGVVVKTKNGLTFEFSTKWKVSMELLNPDREEDDEETKGNK